MKTRIDYIEGACSRREYITQYATEDVIRVIANSTTYFKIVSSPHEEFDDITPQQWDFCSGAVLCVLGNEFFRQRKDVATQSILLEICKEAARIIRLRYNHLRSLDVQHTA
jgi:hypothetical protein